MRDEKEWRGEEVDEEDYGLDWRGKGSQKKKSVWWW